MEFDIGKDENVQKLLDRVSKVDGDIRGRIISQCNYVDAIIGLMISREKYDEKDERIRYYEKEIMKKSLGNTFGEFKKIMDKYPELKTKYVDVLKEIEDDLIPFRNKITHRLGVCPQEFLENEYENDRIVLIRHFED